MKNTSKKCPRCGEAELNQELTCPLCKQSYFEESGKLFKQDVGSQIYQPETGHPDACNCKRQEDGKVIWTEECLEDRFVQWQNQRRDS